MSLKRHHAFTPASREDSKLWRYTSLPNYLSLLQDKGLFMCNLELMANGDPFEGTLPPSKFKHRDWNKLDDLPNSISQKLLGHLKPGEQDLIVALNRFKESAEHKIRQTYVYRKSYFINCWHLNEYESSAMWDVYSRKKEGIAILSSESHFIDAFRDVAEDIFGGVISYGDYDAENFEIADNNGFIPVLYKRKSFEYEHEYRLVYWDTSVTHKQLHAENGYFNWDGRIVQDILGSGIITAGRSNEEIENLDQKPGFNLKCDLNALISKIYVSTLAEDCFYQIIKDVSEKYGILAPVVKSSLNAEPLK